MPTANRELAVVVRRAHCDQELPVEVWHCQLPSRAGRRGEEDEEEEEEKALLITCQVGKNDLGGLCAEK